jgi:hypothetical protein
MIIPVVSMIAMIYQSEKRDLALIDVINQQTKKIERLETEHVALLAKSVAKFQKIDDAFGWKHSNAIQVARR